MWLSRCQWNNAEEYVYTFTKSQKSHNKTLAVVCVELEYIWNMLLISKFMFRNVPVKMLCDVPMGVGISETRDGSLPLFKYYMHMRLIASQSYIVLLWCH